jgi:hypothetical protein
MWMRQPSAVCSNDRYRCRSRGGPAAAMIAIGAGSVAGGIEVFRPERRNGHAAKKALIHDHIDRCLGHSLRANGSKGKAGALREL